MLLNLSSAAVVIALRVNKEPHVKNLKLEFL